MVAGLAGCSEARTTSKTAAGSPSKTGPSQASGSGSAPTTKPFHAPVGIVKVRVPRGTIYGLPGKGNNMALTVDDGTDPRVVAGYAKLAKDTGLRPTFFCNGVNPSWTESAPALRPLLDEGQIFMCNHT